jgi:hypothetical protein
MYSHTSTAPSSEPIDVFSAEQCRRLQWLRRKLLNDLAAARKIFVYQSEDGMTDQEAKELHSALCRYNEGIALFCVRLEEKGHPAGTLDQIHNRLFAGYIDKMSTVDISVGLWVSLCQRVAMEIRFIRESRG